LDIPNNQKIKPSDKIWNSMYDLNPLGVFLTLIDINIITGEPVKIDMNVKNLTIDDDMLDAIYLASGLLSSQDYSLNDVLKTLEYIIDEYSFDTRWVKTGADMKLYTTVNVSQKAINDIINQYSSYIPSALTNNLSFFYSPLDMFGFPGLPYFPAGLLKPIPEFKLDYTIEENQEHPNLVMKYVVDNPIKQVGENINLFLRITNIGDKVAWGMKLYSGWADINALTLGLFPAGTYIRYEVRGFYIPQLFQSNPVDVLYGSGNILLDYNSYTGSSTIKTLLSLADTGPGGNDDGYASLEELNVISSSGPLNYIEPGKTIEIDMSTLASNGMFSTFNNETAHFTNSSIITGVQTGNITDNNDTNAYSADLTTWNIRTTSSGPSHDIVIDFNFTSEIGNFTLEDVDALRFTYVGYNNQSIYPSGEANVYIFNYNTSQWVPINNITRPNDNVSLNQTDAQITQWTDIFTIYNAENDTQNNTINITHYLSGPNNTVRVRLALSNNQSTLMQIDYFGMDYLKRNETTNRVPPSNIIYTDFDGKVLRSAVSGSVHVGSQNVSSLIVFQEISGTDYSLSPGTMKNLTITVMNNGSEIAENVNLSILIPGIIVDPGEFTVNVNSLNMSLGSIGPATTVMKTFSFLIPNSIKISGSLVEYNNHTKISSNGSDFIDSANDVYIDAPVSYSSTSTMPKIIQVNMLTKLTSASIPDVNETFNVNVSVGFDDKPSILDNVNITIPNTTMFNSCIQIKTNILLPGAEKNGYKIITINKTSYKGYLLPPLAINTENAMGNLMRVKMPAPMQVGNMKLSIVKTIYLDGKSIELEKFHIRRDSEIMINITIKNTGNLPIGFLEYNDPSMEQGFQINDNEGFNQSGFVVISGKVSLANITLQPGQETSFNYTIKAIRVGNYWLGKTSREYFFVKREVSNSTAYKVTIDEKIELIVAYLASSLGTTIIIAILSIHFKKKQQRAYEEFMKRDKVLYQMIQENKEKYEQYLD
ncbi:MAG: hypothetical protein ACTSXU_02945, partial [Promethearchaeota archaeon]